MPEQTRLERWFAVQSALVALAVALFAVFHLWVQWPALLGREAWLERVRAYAGGESLGVVVVGLLLAHALCAAFVALRARSRDSADARGRGAVRFRATMGLLFGAFALYHLSHVWPRPDGDHATVERSYQLLWQVLGRPLVLGAYVLGCAALAGYVAHALWLALEARLPGPLRAILRYAAGLCGFVLFASYLQLIARFAAGEPLLPGVRENPYAALEADDAHSALQLSSPHASDARGGGEHVP